MSVHKKAKNNKWEAVEFFENEGTRYLKERDKDLDEVDVHL
jgi:hypothetical protein